MYPGGKMSEGSAPDRPPSSQPLLQPARSQLHSSTSTGLAGTASATMRGAPLCQPSLGNHSNPNLMPRLKQLGMEPGTSSRPTSNFHSALQQRNVVETKRKWDETLEIPQQAHWLRRDMAQQASPSMAPQLSPSLPVGSGSTATDQNKRYNILPWSTTYRQEISPRITQAESSRQWNDILTNHVSKAVHPEKKQVPGEAFGAGAAAFSDRQERNASVSPTLSEDYKDNVPLLELRRAWSADSELKQAGSVSSDDFVDAEPVRGERGGPQSRNNYSSHNSTFTVSKNLVSERKRRKKLNDGLYSLRALVPKISKMDKASIVGDAIEHVKELQEQIQAIELEIVEMRSRNSFTDDVVDEDDSGASRLSDQSEQLATTATATATAQTAPVASVASSRVTSEVALASKNLVDAKSHVVLGASASDNIVTVASTADVVTVADSRSPPFPPADRQRKILKIEVSKLEGQTFQVQLSCEKGPGVLVQLMRALESVDMDVLNAYHTAFQESMLNTFVVEMISLDVREIEDVRSVILEAIAQHGLTLQPS